MSANSHKIRKSEKGLTKPIQIIRIYLSGSIKKGDDPQVGYYWTDEDEKYLKKTIKGVNVELLNPAKTQVLRNDPFANFGCDLGLVKISNFLIADVREKRGIGVGSEMTMAKFYSIPVISLCPKQSHYRRDKLEVYGEALNDWIHPFVIGLSDVVVENLTQAVDWINEFLSSPKPVKGIEVVENAIQHYEQTQYPLPKS